MIHIQGHVVEVWRDCSLFLSFSGYSVLYSVLLAEPPSLQDFENKISKLTSYSAPEPSGITYNMLKKCPSTTTRELYKCLKQMWVNKHIATSWKWRWLVPIPIKPTDLTSTRRSQAIINSLFFAVLVELSACFVVFWSTAACPLLVPCLAFIVFGVSLSFMQF